MNTCQHCRYWKQLPPYHRSSVFQRFGLCKSVMFVDENREGDPPDNYTNNMLVYSSDYGYSGSFMTGPDFGCIHWEAT